MPETFDELFVRLARERGWWPAAPSDTAAFDLADAPRRALDVLGWKPSRIAELLDAGADRFAALDPARLAEARAWLARVESATRAAEPATQPRAPVTVGDAPAVRSSPLAPGRRFGRFEIVREIGRGGMGAVYQAWHPGLQTHFALKILLPGAAATTGQAARFLQEARALARLDHPGLVRVHDVGEEDGRAWFAMEYLEGETVAAFLERIGGQATAHEAVAIVREAAEAIAAAHRAGVLHRDLKPGNLLRGRDGRLRVMDFGLAKVLDSGAASVTRTRQLLGTPPYLSPEHVEGGMKAVNERSDVYQLGATLYELLTGCRPYEGEAGEILVAISRGEPPPPSRRRPGVDRRAAAICQTAMARDPARRYASAAELAEDCRRWLAGEPVRARPDTALHRLARGARRRPAVSGALAALAAGLLVAIAMAARGRALEAEVLEALRRTARSDVEAVLAVRRAGGKVAAARDRFLPDLQAAVDSALALSPGLAEPHYHLGRFFRALMRFDEARDAQERALAADPGHLAALYERVVLRSREYGDRITGLREQWLRREGRSRVDAQAAVKTGLEGWSREPPPPDDELAAADPTACALRAATLDDLAAIELRVANAAPGATAGADGFSPGAAACARGIALSYRGGAERAEARALLQQALADDPSREEAYEALARVERADGAEAAAAKALERAVAADAGYVPFWIDLGVARAALGRRPPEGRTAVGEWEAALAAFERALALDPNAVDAWIARGRLQLYWGLFLGAHGGDGCPRFEAGDHDFATALRLSPDSAEARLGREMLLGTWGRQRAQQGEDPEPQYRQAIAELDALLRHDPERLEGWTDRAEIRRVWAVHLDGGGQDPFPLFDEAQRDLEEARRIAPQDALPLVRLGCLRMDRGVALQRRGRDCDAELDAALTDLDRAAALEPKSVEPWWRRANIMSFRASMAQAKRADPEPFFQEGVRCLQHALELAPKDGVLWDVAGMHWSSWLAWRLANRKPADEQFREAIAAYDHALAAFPTLTSALRGRGDMLAQWGQALLRHRKTQEGLSLLERAEADYSRGLELAPLDASLWVARGTLRRERAMFQPAGPTGAESEAWALSRADFEKAVALAPDATHPRLMRARLFCIWSSFRQARRQDAAELTTAACADFDAIIAREPDNAHAHLGRGELHYAAGRWADAVTDLEIALRLAPAPDPYFPHILRDARARLGGVAGSEEWRTALERGHELVRAGRYTDARGEYARGLDAHRRHRERLPEHDIAAFDQAAREPLQQARYNLACVFSLASVGKEGPEAPGHELPPTDAAALRDIAFEHLSAAFALGWRDGAHLDEDSDLAPLRDDPRWEALRASVGR